MMKFRYQFAADVVRDGLSLELTDERWNPLAKVFRCDASNTFTVSVFAEELPFTEIEKLVLMARKELGSFEDGTPLPDPLELDDG
jgi:hypothetical protein